MNIKAASFDLKSFKFLLEVSRVRKYILIIIWLSRNKFQIQKRASENLNTKLFFKQNLFLLIVHRLRWLIFLVLRGGSSRKKKKGKSLSCLFSRDLTLIHTMNLLTLESPLFSHCKDVMFLLALFFKCCK